MFLYQANMFPLRLPMGFVCESISVGAQWLIYNSMLWHFLPFLSKNDNPAASANRILHLAILQFR